jgi:hypothetical protein
LTYALKYTDQHVADEENLFRRIATEYVQNYHGNFDLLIDYRRRVEAGLPLSIPMIRATLNCMRHDARVVNLPPPRSGGRASDARVIELRPRRGFGPVQHRWVDDEDDEEEYVPPPPKPRRYVQQKTSWKLTYAASTWVSAYLIHRVHPDSFMELDRETNIARPVVWFACKSGAYQMGKVPIAMMDAVQAYAVLLQNKGMSRMCVKCDEKYGDIVNVIGIHEGADWYVGRSPAPVDYAWEPMIMNESREEMRARLEELYQQ